MKKSSAMVGTMAFVSFLLITYIQGNPQLKLVQTIPLARVDGRIDHMSADVKGRRLFVAALGNNTLEVEDLSQGRQIRSVTGLHEPQGVAYIPELDQVVVANGDEYAPSV